MLFSITKDDSVSTVTRLPAGRPGFGSWQGSHFISVTTSCGSHPSSYPTGTGELSSEVERPGREGTPPFCADVNAGSH
jgi:hypothetical protein